MKASFIWLAVLLAYILQPIGDVGAFAISPMRLSLDATGGVEVIRLRNNRDIKREVMLQAFVWTKSDDPAALVPTDDLLVVPPVFEVQPNGEQVVRIALRKPARGDHEKPYRLLITEVPSKVSERQGLNFALEVNLPIFVTPKGAAADPHWSMTEDESQRSVLVLKNEGNAHMKVLSVDVDSADDDIEPINVDVAGYIFAGEEKRWLVEADLGELRGPVTLKAKTTKGSIESLISPPGG